MYALKGKLLGQATVTQD